MGQRVYLALTVQEISVGVDLQSLLTSFSAHNEPLVNVLHTAMLGVSMLWIFQILKGHSTYPKYVAIFNPAIILSSIIGLYVVAPKLGGLLIPNAMNVTHIIIFSLSLWTGKNLNSAG